MQEAKVKVSKKEGKDGINYE